MNRQYSQTRDCFPNRLILPFTNAKEKPDATVKSSMATTYRHFFDLLSLVAII